LLTVRRSGGLEVYNINNNQLTGAAFIDAVGLDWQFAGIAPIHGPGASDLVLRNVNTGNSKSTTSPTIRSPDPRRWVRLARIGSLAAFAASSPTGSMGSSDDQAGSNSQLVQAMAASVAAAVQVKA
jgi:hypothetical protein